MRRYQSASFATSQPGLGVRSRYRSLSGAGARGPALPNRRSLPAPVMLPGGRPGPLAATRLNRRSPSASRRAGAIAGRSRSAARLVGAVGGVRARAGQRGAGNLSTMVHAGSHATRAGRCRQRYCSIPHTLANCRMKAVRSHHAQPGEAIRGVPIEEGGGNRLIGGQAAEGADHRDGERSAAGEDRLGAALAHALAGEPVVEQTELSSVRRSMGRPPLRG